MAKPIKMTPVLSGRDASNFLHRLEHNSKQSVSKEYLSSIRASAQKLQSIFKGK